MDPTVSKSPEAAVVIAFQTAIEDALVKGDSAFLKQLIADDFSMVHGDIWIRGGPADHVDGKDDFLRYAATKHYTVRDDDHVRIEMHGDAAAIAEERKPLCRLRAREGCHYPQPGLVLRLV